MFYKIIPFLDFLIDIIFLFCYYVFIIDLNLFYQREEVILYGNDFTKKQL